VRFKIVTSEEYRLPSDGIVIQKLNISCHFLHLPKGFHFKDISKLGQRMATTYRLLIAIEHALPNWPLVDYKEEVTITLDDVCIIKS
jgi:hypothetical protein